TQAAQRKEGLMGSTTQELTGPDLANGVDLKELEDGTPLLGHAAGEPVVLVRKGKDVFAVGTTCSHYGGPLGAGVVRGDGTIHCPWHHACFDLGTGEAIGGPALNPIPCYEIVRRGERVSVGGKRDVPKRSLSGAAPKSVVVVGAGAAGAAAVEAVR